MPAEPPIEVSPALKEPDLTRFPDASDLRDFLEFSNLYDQTVQRQSLVAATRAAARRWADRTGYLPFLAEDVSTIRRFHPPGDLQNRRSSGRVRGGGQLLQLESGLVSVPDFVSVEGQPLDAGDWWGEPINALAQGKPITTIEFAYPIWGAPQSLGVSGRWGYAAQVPDDAWYATLLSGAAIAMFSIRNDPDVVGVSEDGFSQEFDQVGAIVPAHRLDAWTKFYKQTLNDFRLVTM